MRFLEQQNSTAAERGAVANDPQWLGCEGIVTVVMTEQGRGFSADRARAIGERIGIDWDRSRFDVEQFRLGLGVELEHGRRDPETNVTDDDELTTGKIARAHLNEFPDYYTRLARMETEAEQYWAGREPPSAA